MFWRFAFREETGPRVLLVNTAEIVESICAACGARLASDPKGESILVAASSGNGNRHQCYCADCSDERWVPTLAGRALNRYALDWAMPLRQSLESAG